MRTDLSVRAIHCGDMRVHVHVRGHALPMDYPAEGERNPTPLEVLLASLAGCAANTLNLVLSRMGVIVSSLEVDARAERRAEHPTVLSEIELVYWLGCGGVEVEIVNRAVRIAEDQLCPVLNMLRPGTTIRSSWVLEPASVHG
jgi:putative redox protein